MNSRPRGFLDRNLASYPANTHRIWYLVLAVAATIILYYESYVLPSVVLLVLPTFHMTFSSYILLILASNFLGALTSLIGGLTDRLGRANLVVYGVLATSLITLLIAFARTVWLFVLLSLLLGVVEGIILVATPALVRDFSPRLGRATAMAFWTIGPVGGSLLATAVAGSTLEIYGSWQSQYIIAAVVGLVMAILCFLGLRDLSPALRSQIMLSLREKALLEARARGIDVERSLQHPWRQMLRPRILISALGISLFLLLYYATVGYFPTYFNAIFKYPLDVANSLLAIYWFVDILSSIIGGLLSDLLEVRKPFMIVGTVTNLIVLFVFISRVGQPASPTFMGVLLALLGLTGPIAYVSWMAGYTETLEDVNPALVGTGVALWGFVVRSVVVLSTLGFNFTVVNTSNAGQWEIWWWVCALGMMAFLPTVFLATGRWNPRRARAETRARLTAEGLAAGSL